MKRIAFFLFGVISIVGCSNEENLIDNQPETKKSVITRSLVDAQQPSVTNPELMTNWENVETIQLNSAVNVTAPWECGASSSLSETFCRDIKKEDGWTMLFHTFKKNGLDPGQNYMCFYNMFTGYLKVFYYYEGENQSQSTQWYVKTIDGKNSKLFGLGGYFSQTSTDIPNSDMVIVTNMTHDQSKGLTCGWNGFEFEVPYCCETSELMIGAYNRNITSYNLNGIVDLSTVGTITKEGKDLAEPFKTLLTLYGDTASVSIKKYVDKTIFGGSLKKLLFLSPNNYLPLLTMGLNAIFGKTTKTAYDVKLTTTGNITFSGTGFSETTSGVRPVRFNLYDIMVHNGLDVNGNIGAWSVPYTPQISYYRHMKMSGVRVTGTSTSYTGSKNYHIEGSAETPKVYMSRYTVDVNDRIKDYLISSNISYKFIKCDSIDGQKYKPGIIDFSDIKTSSAYLFYTNGNIKLFEYEPTIVDVGGWIDKDPSKVHSFYYDWGNIDCGRMIAVISVSNKFNYNGKIIEVDQSRCYETQYFVDPIRVEDVGYYNMYPYNSTINYGEPYFDTYKRMYGLPVIDYDD